MIVFIGLGSNLENPQTHILTAINDISLLEPMTFLSQSSLYQSPPMGPQDQPDYINAVIKIDTHLTAHSLLDVLQSLEQKHGRVRKRHWGERTLDLDILLYGNEVISDERLSIPHPGITERAFVLYPLAEIDNDISVPGKGIVSTLKEFCPLDGLKKLEANTL